MHIAQKLSPIHKSKWAFRFKHTNKQQHQHRGIKPLFMKDNIPLIVPSPVNLPPYSVCAASASVVAPLLSLTPPHLFSSCWLLHLDCHSLCHHSCRAPLVLWLALGLCFCPVLFCCCLSTCRALCHATAFAVPQPLTVPLSSVTPHCSLLLSTSTTNPCHHCCCHCYCHRSPPSIIFRGKLSTTFVIAVHLLLPLSLMPP